ncbi:hypothetical protein STEG23_035623, partial [Scotinomys teguina]
MPRSCSRHNAVFQVAFNYKRALSPGYSIACYVNMFYFIPPIKSDFGNCPLVVRTNLSHPLLVLQPCPTTVMTSGVKLHFMTSTLVLLQLRKSTVTLLISRPCPQEVIFYACQGVNEPKQFPGKGKEGISENTSHFTPLFSSGILLFKFHLRSHNHIRLHITGLLSPLCWSGRCPQADDKTVQLHFTAFFQDAIV